MQSRKGYSVNHDVGSVWLKKSLYGANTQVLTVRIDRLVISPLVRLWHQAAVVVLNSDKRHGFFRSVVARKAAVKYREISANLILVQRAGKSPGCVKTRYKAKSP